MSTWNDWARATAGASFTDGGPYPLLRITAKYLQVDYHSIIVGCREVGDGWSGLNGNQTESLEPDAWAILSF